jgi:hypothetical protein
MRLSTSLMRINSACYWRSNFGDVYPFLGKLIVSNMLWIARCGSSRRHGLWHHRRWSKEALDAENSTVGPAESLLAYTD